MMSLRCGGKFSGYRKVALRHRISGSVLPWEGRSVSSKFIHGVPFPRIRKSPPHRGRAQSRPSAASRRVAWTGGSDAISSETREWQATWSRLPVSKVLASSPRFHSHFF